MSHALYLYPLLAVLGYNLRSHEYHGGSNADFQPTVRQSYHHDEVGLVYIEFESCLSLINLWLSLPL